MSKLGQNLENLKELMTTGRKIKLMSEDYETVRDLKQNTTRFKKAQQQMRRLIEDLRKVRGY